MFDKKLKMLPLQLTEIKIKKIVDELKLLK